MTDDTSSKWLWIIGLGATAAGALYLLKPSHVTAPESESGWYALGFNYARGNRNRRLKMVEGPFPTRGEALAKTKTLKKQGWYTLASRHTVHPFKMKTYRSFNA